MRRVAFLLLPLCAVLLSSNASAQLASETHRPLTAGPAHSRVTRYVMIRVASPRALEQIAMRRALHTDPLMPRAGIYRAWSSRYEDGEALSRALEADVASHSLLAVEPDYEVIHRPADIAIPPNDERYGGQWYLDRIGIEGAWRLNVGSPSTTVAVIDDGCDLTHPDLAAKLLPGLDVYDGDDDPSYLPNGDGNSHGTACAGLVGAVTDNSIGVAGTCPECTLRCVRLLGPSGSLVPLSADVMAFNFALESDVAVISNSWGYEHGAPVSFMLRTAIETVMREGRGGLGTVVVFAAGNDAAEIAANELGAIEGIITVGALNNFDESAPFSNFGASLDITAPTGTLALDIHGADGDVSGDYTSLFGGTSSSAPIVAGVAALMIAEQPTITGAEVSELLHTTARPAPFATPDENGHDDVYGYGVINPEGALMALRAMHPADAGVDASTDDAGVDGAAPPPQSGCQCDAAAGHAPTTAWVLFAFAILASVIVVRRAACFFLLALPFVVSACAIDSRDVGAAKSELRPNTPGATELPPRFDPTDIVESLASPGGSFRIHYTRAGSNAVPATDTDLSGVPDYVEFVATTYDAVLAFYESLAYRTPIDDVAVPTDHGGDGRFDVYLVDFGGSADGAFRRELCAGADGCSGYMLQENDFAGCRYPSREYGARLLASHEFFHAIQAAYDGELSAQGSVLSEGTAVWASEQFDATQFDVEGFASAYFDRSDKSLGVDPIGPVQSFSYGSGVFFEFLSQNYDVDLIRLLWDEVHANPSQPWLSSLDYVLVAHETTDLESAFVEFAQWNWFTDARAQAGVGYAQAIDLPLVHETASPLPFEDTSIRLQPASVRYFRIALGAPSPVTVRLASSAPAASVHILYTTLAGTTVQSAVELALPSDSVTVPSNADSLLLALIDARTEGSGQVVSLCVATTASDGCDSLNEEVDASVPVSCDGGASCDGEDASAEVDAGPPSIDSSGCSVAAAPSKTPGWPLFGLTLVLTIAFTRRRRPAH
ncbi:MAG: S8 family serine peptidase [Sandaracinaceae bacterium]|nr:S8 family serine peptidase [Sandaracinaceae bacterium]